MWAEQKGREGGRKRQRIEGGDEHGYGNGDGKLLVQKAFNTAERGHGDEHRGKHQCDADDGSGYFFHRLDGCVVRRESVLDVMLDCLHDHDSVIDHEADGEDQSKERKGINGKTEHRKNDEGADERDVHGEESASAPV
jgi:hypothetical protein